LNAISTIILAAGMSRRMGRHKALLPVGDRAMIAHVVDRFSPSIYVVTGFESKRVEQALRDRDVTFVHNPNYHAGGMLSSIQLGVRAARNSKAFFISLGDQPFISSHTLREMRTTFESSDALVILPTYKGKRGHPVLISSAFADEILSLAPDQTLRDFIKRHSHETREIEVDDPAVVQDIDTPEDYARLLAHRGEPCEKPTPIVADSVAVDS
jgi:molybdenum cofactor cytidylyltransferase